MGVDTGCGQCMVDLHDYLVMKHPTPLVSVPFCSLIPTFCSIFVIVFSILVYNVCIYYMLRPGCKHGPL